MHDNIYIDYHQTIYGELIIGSYQDRLCLCDWRYRKMRNTIDSRLINTLKSSFKESDSDIIKTTKEQLGQYFMGDRTIFEIPMQFVGTDFQKKVWNELLNIPYGSTISYMGLSKLLGNEKAVRAVGTANGANAISIIVPCHRVVGSNGEPVGYAGGLGVKMKLLELENASSNTQMSLF